VPEKPTAHQQSVLETVCDLAARIVVMTAAAEIRLIAGYMIDASKVDIIPHGATPPVLAPRTSDADGVARPRLLTWGLLGPGKGIEHMIGAMSILGDLRPRITYTVAGATHPNVFARDGDQYRQSLIRDSCARGVARSVTFDDTYRGVADLMRLVAASSLVVLPYDSRDQVTSGVLVDAIAAGRPVIATAFPHAVEMLSDGAGIVVPHRNPEALAAAIRTAVSEPGLLGAMAARASEIAPSLSWHSVTSRYRRLCDVLVPVGTAVAM
jgi:glycosyltransferase involved in cell wall biosynthesis